MKFLNICLSFLILPSLAFAAPKANVAIANLNQHTCLSIMKALENYELARLNTQKLRDRIKASKPVDGKPQSEEHNKWVSLLPVLEEGEKSALSRVQENSRIEIAIAQVSFDRAIKIPTSKLHNKSEGGLVINSSRSHGETTFIPAGLARVDFYGPMICKALASHNNDVFKAVDSVLKEVFADFL